MPTSKLTPEIITAAIEGFESQKRQIDEQISELRSMLTGSAETATTPEAPAPKRKKFSAASKRKMAEAQRLRWAKIKGESETPAPAQPLRKAKRKLSPAAKAKLVANLRKARAAKKAKAAVAK